MFYGLAWLEWNGRQAVLFDLAARKFYIFGLVFWPQDVIYLTVLLILSALSLFLFTAVAGRLWCGYACPQTVYTEIFLWIERKIEGDAVARKRLDAEPRSLRKFVTKALKHTAWITLALWTGYTFVGYCSDSARMYDGKADACTDFATYRKVKNIALWESADGAFDAYPSCELAPEAIRAAKPVRIAVERKGAITQVVCDYGNGIRFTHRTRAVCRVDGAGTCSTPENCRATCE